MKTETVGVRKRFVGIFVVVVILFFPGRGSRAQNVSDLFVGMKDNMILPMDSDNRLDLIDLYHAGKKSFIINNLKDTCVLEDLREDYLSLSMPRSHMEIAMLPMINDTKVIMVIKTWCGPVCDSELSFYTSSWKEIDASVFIKAVGPSWFMKNQDENDYHYIAALQLLDMNLMAFHYDPDKKALQQTFTTPQYVSKEERWKLKNYVKADPKIYRWDQTHFE